MERVNKRWQRVDDPTKCGYVNLVGYSSAYESPEIAVESTWSMNSNKKDKEDKEIVLFVICLQNYNENGFKGFRLNKSEYSAYPDEQRVILIDGLEMVVVKTESHDVDKIENKSIKQLIGSFEKPKFTIVYLLNTYLM